MTEQEYELFLSWRGIDTPCEKCAGTGVVCYGSTCGWMGGIGGQQLTSGVCDKCWGTGDATRPGANLRKILGEMRANEDKIKRLSDELSKEKCQRIASEMDVDTWRELAERAESLLQDAEGIDNDVADKWFVDMYFAKGRE